MKTDSPEGHAAGQSLTDGDAVKMRVFSWQWKCLQTTVHPPFPLHLDFRWPILHRVVTLETAPYVFIESDWVDMEKGEQETRHGLWYRFSSSLVVQRDGVYFAKRLFNWTECSLWSHPGRHIIPHLATAAGCPLYWNYKMFDDLIW